MGKTTSRHIASTNEITSLMKRGINKSLLIYVAAKNITFEAINKTVHINKSPFISRRNERERGEEGEIKISHVIIINLFVKNMYINKGSIRIIIINNINPVFTGCQIVLIKQGVKVP